ncbi:MAG: YceD family protein [Porticoccaceae bacterium]
MSTPPERKQLPRQVDPRKLVAQGTTLSGDVPTAAMMRLAGAVLGAGEVAQAELLFRRDDSGHSVVEGSVALEVSLECQRCLKPVAKTLAGELHLGIVGDEEQAQNLPKRLEPWIVASETTDLFDLVEDELLLALPIVAFHDRGECEGHSSYSTGQIEDSAENPFGILAQLKTRQ